MKPTKAQHRQRRKVKIRSKISGTAARPRLTVFVSLTAIRAQVIDDTAGKTLAAANGKGKNIEAAKKVGASIADLAKKAGITTVVFDRNARKYHGRVKALADAAREKGLTF